MAVSGIRCDTPEEQQQQQQQLVPLFCWTVLQLIEVPVAAPAGAPCPCPAGKCAPRASGRRAGLEQGRQNPLSSALGRNLWLQLCLGKGRDRCLSQTKHHRVLQVWEGNRDWCPFPFLPVSAPPGTHTEQHCCLLPGNMK